jgi:hypothetical protein
MPYLHVVSKTLLPTQLRPIISAAIAASLATIAWADSPSHTYRSPDGRLVAKVSDRPVHVTHGQQHTDTFYPSRVEIRTRAAKLIAERDHSLFMWPGLAVAQAAWTKDSRFFVYITELEGGHSPWHHPAFVYSRKRNLFFSLDDALAALGGGGGPITGDLKLVGESTLVTTGRYDGKSHSGLIAVNTKGDDSGDRNLTIDLRWLEAHLPSFAISTDRKDKEREAKRD